VTKFSANVVSSPVARAVTAAVAQSNTPCPQMPGNPAYFTASWTLSAASSALSAAFSPVSFTDSTAWSTFSPAFSAAPFFSHADSPSISIAAQIPIAALVAVFFVMVKLP
jgi:hypothetical protein